MAQLTMGTQFMAAFDTEHRYAAQPNVMQGVASEITVIPQRL